MQTTRTARLSEAEKADYQTRGYLVRERAFDDDEVTAMLGCCESLVEKLVRNRRGERISFGSYVFDADAQNNVIIKWEGDSDIVHGIEPFAHLSPELEAWAYDARFIDPVRDLLDTDAPKLFTEKLNLKRPRHGGVNPMHQDYPYWVQVAEEASEIATAMLFLDDSTLDNGCLQVVPGSHRDGAWKGRTDGDRFSANEIDTARYQHIDVVPVEVPAGSLILFGPFLVHQSAPNTSERERRALLFSYQPPGRRTQREALAASLERRR
jgi:ectoine hydroxylase-related dioxygenase (phytanoyl-CoA dioxygenase family)